MVFDGSCAILRFKNRCVKVAVAQNSYQHLVLSSFLLILVTLMSRYWHFLWFYHFSSTSCQGAPFICSLAVHGSSFIKCLFKSFPHILHWAIFLLIKLEEYFIYSGYQFYFSFYIHFYLYPESLALHCVLPKKSYTLSSKNSVFFLEDL